jgi:hypothetical protein
VFTLAETSVDELAKKVTSVEQAEALIPMVAGVTMGKFQIDNLQDPRELMQRSLEIISQSKLITGIGTGAA